MSNILTGHSTTADIFVRRIQTSSVPKEEDAAAKFLLDLYLEKDSLKDTYLKTGSFVASDLGTTEVVELGPRINSLAVIVALNLLISYPLVQKLFAMVLSGSVIQAFLAIAIVLVAHFSMRKMINLTKMSKGSTYGQKKQD